MTNRNVGENFNIVVSTKRTIIGAPTSDFFVYYAPADDLTNRTEVVGGLSEAVETIASGDEHTATLTQPAAYGSRLLYVDDQNSTLEEGDVIEYATGKYGYIMRIVGQKVYLKRPIRAHLSSGDTLTQVGNTGDYTTPTISLGNAGEYIVTVEGPDYGIIVSERVKVIDPSAGSQPDPDAPDEAIAVAY